MTPFFPIWFLLVVDFALPFIFRHHTPCRSTPCSYFVIKSITKISIQKTIFHKSAFTNKPEHFFEKTAQEFCSFNIVTVLINAVHVQVHHTYFSLDGQSPFSFLRSAQAPSSSFLTGRRFWINMSEC